MPCNPSIALALSLSPQPATVASHALVIGFPRTCDRGQPRRHQPSPANLRPWPATLSHPVEQRPRRPSWSPPDRDRDNNHPLPPHPHELVCLFFSIVSYLQTRFLHHGSSSGDFHSYYRPNWDSALALLGIQDDGTCYGVDNNVALPFRIGGTLRYILVLSVVHTEPSIYMH